MNIFNSPLQNVTFQQNNTGGVDYSIITNRINNINYSIQEKQNILKIDVVQAQKPETNNYRFVNINT